MGRANRMGTSAHLIDFWKGMERINLGRREERSSWVAFLTPFSRRRHTRLSPSGRPSGTRQEPIGPSQNRWLPWSDFLSHQRPPVSKGRSFSSPRPSASPRGTRTTRTSRLGVPRVFDSAKIDSLGLQLFSCKGLQIDQGLRKQTRPVSLPSRSPIEVLSWFLNLLRRIVSSAVRFRRYDSRSSPGRPLASTIGLDIANCLLLIAH